MEKILVNSCEYNGKYVAIKSHDDNTIVGSGETPEKAIKNAEEQGFLNPFLVFVPDENIVQIYYAR